MVAQKRLKIYSQEDLDQHSDASSCWVTRNGKVYDITQFLPDHPGGDDIVLPYAGKDVGAIMKDSAEHDHSESAYDMLEDFVVGRFGTGELTVSEDWEATDDFKAEDTNVEDDFEKNEFLDLSKPLVMQVWNANFSKAYYLKQVHQPRHLSYSARMFGPAWMEVLTKTQWWVVPIIWLPISSYIFLRAAFQFTGPLPPLSAQYALPIQDIGQIPATNFLKAVVCFFIGNFIWTFLEYLIHRFTFHIDEFLPDRPLFLMLHFLMHGVHHYLPMDGLRLVMPPTLFIALQAPFTSLAHAIFPAAVANGLISGAFTMYVAYDLTHYALHHTQLPAYWRELKKYHLAHHYKNFELGFGVTSKFWDHIFGTLLKI